jgi:uncharacterized protein
VVLTAIGAIPLRFAVTRGSDAAMLAQQALGAAAGLAATWVVSRLESRAWWSYGLGAVNRWRNLVGGMAAGFIALAGLMALLSGLGFYRLARGPLHGGELAQWGLYWTVVFVCVGIAEETLMRGYPLYTLARGIGFWPAAAIVSAIFGIGHLGNYGEEMVGIANACLAGLVFAYSVRWTGSLWWAIGCHISWDWAETFFFGVADSGIPARHSWMIGTPAGPAWLSGGSVGPEGSVLAAVALLGLAAAVRFAAPWQAVPELERQTAIDAPPEEAAGPPAEQSAGSGETAR